jgi:integrase
MTETSEINALQCAPPAASLPKSAISRKPPPRRRSNGDSGRPREHLKPEEVARLLAAARKTRNPERDEALVLLAFKHGFRVSELVALSWSQVHLGTKLLDVRRVKGGTPSVHPLEPDEVALLKLLRQPTGGKGPVFVSERELPISDSSVKKLVAKLGRAAGLGFPVHAHQLRHACGYSKINAGWDVRHLQAWLGHKNIAHTVHYAQLREDQFADYFDSKGRARRHK